MYTAREKKKGGIAVTVMTMDGLCNYLRDCHRGKAITLVVGHAAPDTDAAVSSVIEAWRRQLMGGAAVPVVRCNTLPTEVRELFCEAAVWLPLGDDPFLTDPSVPVVLTDHHADPLFDGRVIAVIDHHLPAPGMCFSGIDTAIRPVGATTTMIAHLCREQGLIPDAAIARLLLGAILMDTDGLSPHKTTQEDREAVAWLTPLYGRDPMSLFARLQSLLLGETDVETLYRRDYRQYPDANISFAILKVWQHALPDKTAVQRLLEADATQNGRRLCVAKIALYNEQGLQEEHYLTAGDPQAADRLLNTVCAESKGAAIRVSPDEVYLPPGCPRHGRKWYARQLDEILK